MQRKKNIFVGNAKLCIDYTSIVLKLTQCLLLENAHVNSPRNNSNLIKIVLFILLL